MGEFEIFRSKSFTRLTSVKFSFLFYDSNTKPLSYKYVSSRHFPKRSTLLASQTFPQLSTLPEILDAQTAEPVTRSHYGRKNKPKVL